MPWRAEEKMDLYPEWLRYRDKGKNKIVSLHVLFPKTDFPRNLTVPIRQICPGGYSPPQITKPRQGGTADRCSPLQHLPNLQPTYPNVPWETPTHLAKKAPLVWGTDYRDEAQRASTPTIPSCILSFLRASLIHWRQLKLLSTLPATSTYSNLLKVN